MTEPSAHRLAVRRSAHPERRHRRWRSSSPSRSSRSAASTGGSARCWARRCWPLRCPLAPPGCSRVLTSERPGFEAAEALVQLVAMLITGFAAVLYAMNRDGTQVAGLDTRVDAIYFTVTVLSTVGFGDIHATSQCGPGRGHDPDRLRPDLPGRGRPRVRRRREDGSGQEADPRPGGRLEQPAVACDADGIVSISRGELLVDVLDVGLDRVGRHEERSRDLGVPHPGR